MTDPTPVDTDPTSGRSVRRFFVVAVVLSFVGIWGYVMYLSFFVGRAEPADQLEDTDWVLTAEDTCAPVAARIADLPLASEMETPAQRAEVLDVATEELEGMVRRLRALVPPDSPEEATAVGRWLDDWEQFNRDRRAYADRLSLPDPPDEPFRVTERDGYQIDVVLEEFAAKSNDMPSCAPPDDVG